MLGNSRPRPRQARGRPRGPRAPPKLSHIGKRLNTFRIWVKRPPNLVESEVISAQNTPRDRSHWLKPCPSMYSRQTIHHQRVSDTSHDTPGPPSRPSAPVRPSRAPMRDRTARDLARHHGRRTRHAAHQQTRLVAYASEAPGLAARLGAQRIHWPRDDRGRSDMRARRPTWASRVATRVARNTAHWCSAGVPRSSATVMPKVLPRLRHLSGREGTHRPTPEPTGDRPARWNGETGSARRAPSSRSASDPPRPLHISGRSSKSRRR